jgi:hypothetical protein
MAVVQISRIQVRRGKENSGSGLPQLASGEMAWSIDAQNLWIGNGSVAEGAPYVGNTKILTQNDLSSNGNILDLISYQYKKNDYTIVTGTQGANYPFLRDIQQKLDEAQISVHDFGALGDGITNDTAAIQLAVNQLFLNSLNLSAISSRVTLKLPPGKYIITQTIYVPSFATIVGSGKDKTIIQFNNTQSTPGPVFQFVNDTATPGVPRIFSMPTIAQSSYNPVGSAGTTIKLTRADTLTGTTGIVSGMVITGTGFTSPHTVISVDDSTTITISSNPDSVPSGVLTFTAGSAPAPTYLNQPRNITIKDLTVFNNTNDQYGIRLDAVRDSLFENVSIRGAWAQTFYETSAGIYMTAFSRLVTCQRNAFINVDVDGFGYAVYSNNDIQYNTFRSMYIYDTRSGVIFGRTSDLSSTGQLYGPSFNEIVGCHFENIRQHAVYVYNGVSNTTRDSRLANVGNNGGSNLTTAAYPQIYFAVPGNASLNDQSDRSKDLSTSVPSVAATYNPSGSSGSTLVLSNTAGIATGMVISGTGYTGSQTVTNIINGTTLSMSASPNTTPSGTLTFSVPYYPEISGVVSYNSYGINRISISNITSPTFAFRLPLPTDGVGYIVNYVYRSSNRAQSRRGQMTVMADVTNNLVQLSDEYDYVQFASTSEDTKLEFSAQILNKSLNISYKNTSSGDSGVILYSYSAVL